MKLIIDKQSNNPPIPKNDEQLVTFADIVYQVKHPIQFIKNYLFRYQTARLHVYRFDSMARPLLYGLLLRFISRGKIIFTDDAGHQTTITLWRLGQLLVEYGRVYLATKKLLKQRRQLLDQLLAQDILPKSGLNMQNRSLYLRTDIAFGYFSGGSIGHIAGVLNNLHHHAGEPIFVTTDQIPTVDDRIRQHIVNFESEYWHFPEIVSLVSNDLIKDYVEQVIVQVPLSFIYQRYSLNNYVGAQLAIQKKLPFILEYNGSEVWIKRHWGDVAVANEQFALDIELINFKVADVVVVVSTPLKNELVERGVTTEKILVNPNGVNPDVYHPNVDGSAVRQYYNLDDKTVIGFIGTFGAWHGTEVLAEAFGLLLQTYPILRDSVQLLLIGDGQKMPLVKDILNQYQVADSVILTGRVPQEKGAAHLAACDILASPNVPNIDGSPFFSSPTKLFEYMAMGRGIVASDLEQIGEILEHNKTAYMVTPGDPIELMNGLKTLIDNPDLRDQLGKAAREDVITNYTWEKHTDKIIAYLKVIFEEKSKSV